MENESCELGTGESKNHLDMLPIKKGTDHLCESIINQEGFKELYAKIDASILAYNSLNPSWLMMDSQR